MAVEIYKIVHEFVPVDRVNLTLKSRNGALDPGPHLVQHPLS